MRSFVSSSPVSTLVPLAGIALALGILGSTVRGGDPPAEVNGFVVGVEHGGSEKLLEGATVFLADEQGTIVAVTLTDDGGFYHLDGIPPGLYRVAAEAEGFDLRYVDVTLPPGAAGVMNVLIPSTGACADCPFEEIAAARGLADYVASTGDGHGPGGVFADLDNDGYPDLYLVRGRGLPNELYRNAGVPSSLDGRARRFVKIARAGGADDRGGATGAIAGDYDNDGDLDLYVTNFDAPNALYRNLVVELGELRFVDVTEDTDPTPGISDDQHGVGISFYFGVPLDNSLTAAWADVDRDGDLDLYVGNHNGFFGSQVEGPLRKPGRRDILYRNEGNGTFNDITMAAGVPGFETASGEVETPNQRFSSTNAVIFADFDDDRWPDLLVTNKIGGPDDRDMLYRNQGLDAGGAWQGFETVTYDLEPTFGHLSGAAMGVDAGDFDNDGDLDIYITDFAGLPAGPGGNDLWINTLSETGVLGFVPSAAFDAGFSWGTQWQDIDNDGFADLHVATEWGFRDFLYLSDRGTSFEERAVAAGVAQVRNARGDLAADFDRDGFVDFFVVNLDGGPSALFRNRLEGFAPPNHHLSVKLVGNPDREDRLRSTRDAIGARVRVRADLDGDGTIEADETQIREVVSGNSNATSTSSLELEFGLGRAATAEVEVDWPSGVRSVHALPAGKFVTLHEPEA